MIDSSRLVECIFNNGCTAEDELTIPSYIQTEGTLNIAKNSYCSKLNNVNKQWTKIVIGNSICNTITTLELSNWPKLEQVIIGSGSFTAITSINLGKRIISIVTYSESSQTRCFGHW